MSGLVWSIALAARCLHGDRSIATAAPAQPQRTDPEKMTQFHQPTAVCLSGSSASSDSEGVTFIRSVTFPM